MKWFACFLVFCAFFLVGQRVSAQGIAGSSPIVFEVTPALLAPGESYDIEISSLYVDLTTARINWSVNGAYKQGATGMTRFRGVAPALGDTHIVSVSVLTPTQSTPINASYTIISGSIDLLWQANTYTPPFYLGRSLPSSGATIQVTAVPTFVGKGSLLRDTQDFVYRWKVNDEPNQEQSGLGSRSLVYQNDNLDSSDLVDVQVITRDGFIDTRENASMVMQTPSPVLEYRDNQGLWRAIQNQPRIAQSEIPLRVVPYFSAGGLQSLSSKWMVNNTVIREGSVGQPVSLQVENPGALDIEVTLDAVSRLFQRVSTRGRIIVEE